MSYLNEEQEAYAASIAAIPRELRCECGWYIKGECYSEREPHSPECRIRAILRHMDPDKHCTCGADDRNDERRLEGRRKLRDWQNWKMKQGALVVSEWYCEPQNRPPPEVQISRCFISAYFIAVGWEEAWQQSSSRFETAVRHYGPHIIRNARLSIPSFVIPYATLRDLLAFDMDEFDYLLSCHVALVTVTQRERVFGIANAKR